MDVVSSSQSSSEIQIGLFDAIIDLSLIHISEPTRPFEFCFEYFPFYSVRLSVSAYEQNI